MRGAECHMRCAGRNSKKVIQKEPTAGYSPKAKGFTERHNLTLLVMLADSAAAPFCLPSLGAQHAADAIIYANDLHNTTPAANAMVCSAPHEGLLKRAVKLSVDRKFGCPVGIQRPRPAACSSPEALALWCTRPLPEGWAPLRLQHRAHACSTMMAP